jgi:hypothetical protein
MVVRHDWDECFKFSFVRNPWDRVVSLFMFQTKGDQIFKDWLMDIVERDGSPRDRKKAWKLLPKMASTGGTSLPWKSQTDWLIDNDGKLCMDFIGRYENLKEDFSKICDILGRNIKLPHINKTEHLNYKSYYDAETKQIVADWHRNDINNFGYTFGSLVTML